jgi:predicted ester cyclase
MKTVPQDDPKGIQDHSAKLAATLGLKPNADCFKQPVDQQVNCPTQSSAPVLFEDGHGKSVAEALSTVPSSDSINALRRFYAEDFISLMLSDTSIRFISRTLGQDQLVDEMIFSFSHTEEMPWMLPGIPPTHRHVDISLVVVVGFREGKLAHERIYWDQASVLKQIGLLTDSSLPVFGAETAQKLLDPAMP